MAEPQQQVEEPCSEVEAAIGAVWCEVLGIARVSKTASFFDLGGDSIQATRAIQRINRALAADLDFELLYTARTIEALAACVRDQADASRVLRALWMEVLGASEIAAADNFFDLGGHPSSPTR